MDKKKKPKVPPEDKPKFEVVHGLEPMHLDELGPLMKVRG